MSLMVCEDEEKVRQYLVSSLGLDGTSIFQARGPEELWMQLEQHGEYIEILILDRLLGQVDSLRWIRSIKTKYPNLKILILSAIHTPEQKAEALDAGADDYVEKPFRLIELQARIRVLKRNRMTHLSSATEPSVIIQRKNLLVDRLKHQARVGNTLVDLSNKEYNVLITLLLHPGRVYSRYQLLDIVWSMHFDVESNVVEVTIKNLRRKLEQAKCEVLIESRRNVGYWIEE